MDNIERSELEKQLANRMARNLPAHDLEDYTTCRHAVRYMCRQGSTLLQWSISDGKPIINDVYNVIDVDMSWAGLAAKVVAKSGHEQWIDHQPGRLGNSHVFAHVPYLPEIRYIPNRENNFRLMFPLIFKQLSTPLRKLEGQMYLTDVPTLVSLFPDQAGRRF